MAIDGSPTAQGDYSGGRKRLEMPFELGGKYGNEAFDTETGMHIRSRGARGPEIESQSWQVEVCSQKFQFHTYVMENSDDGKRTILLTPDRSFLGFINDPEHPLEYRRNRLKVVIDGLYFIFPTYFRAPFCFLKGNPPASFGDRGLWGDVELSR
jgi:hypothetical protein